MVLGDVRWPPEAPQLRIRLYGGANTVAVSGCAAASANHARSLGQRKKTRRAAYPPTDECSLAPYRRPNAVKEAP